MARIAIISDIHGNRTAFEAVAADLKAMAPDLVLHGGDLADSGSAPVEIVDRIRELGWQGVAGNTDEMLFRPESLTLFASRSPQLRPLFDAIEEMAAATREALGEKRVAWLRALPQMHCRDELMLVHASPGNLWVAPQLEASEAELAGVYGSLEGQIVIYGHIHRPFTRTVAGKRVINTGSVGLPYDGDARASYLLLDGEDAQIRRVEYDVQREIAAVRASGRPHAEWMARMLASARPEMP